MNESPYNLEFNYFVYHIFRHGLAQLTLGLAELGKKPRCVPVPFILFYPSHTTAMRRGGLYTDIWATLGTLTTVEISPSKVQHLLLRCHLLCTMANLFALTLMR